MDDTNSSVIADAAPPFPSFTALRARHSELLQRDPDPEDAKSCLADVENFIKQAQATGAILSDDEERRSSQNILNYWVSALYRQDQVARLVTLADYDPKLTTRIEDARCPYPGVRAFTEQDSQFFFGRQRQIDYMLNRLREDRLLVLVGPSGSGKTSLVQAGLLPALKKEELNSVKYFYFPPAVPGSEPLMNLARMIKHAKNADGEDPQWLEQQVEGFQNDEGHFLKLIEETTDKPAVIFIDQGEELYELGGNRFIGPLKEMLGLDQGGKALRPFLGNLLHVVQSPLRRHIVILARRIGDYEPYFRRLPSKFKDVFEPARMVLPALYASELRDAIEKPAELLGVKFDELSLASPEAPGEAAGSRAKETTVQALVKEISSEPVGLPLLQFTLPRLWEKREGDQIPDQAFRDLRSCRAALADTAEEFFEKLDFLDQLACRRLLSQLIKLDGELRPYTVSVQRAELYPAAEKKSRIDSLIERLRQKELIRVSEGEVPADDVVELVHASLLRSWPRLNSWIGSKRRVRWWSKIAAGLLLLVLISGLALIGAFFLGQRQQVEQSRELARRSNKEFSNNRFDQALLLAREAYAVEPNATTRSNTLRLLYALQSTSQPKMFLRKDKFEAEDMVFSAENSPARLAALDYKGDIVIWNLTTRPQPIEKTLVSAKKATYPLAFSPNGKKLATASLEPEVALILWDLETNQPTTLPQENKEFAVTSLAFAPDGKTLVAGDQDGNVFQWDLRNTNGDKPTPLFKHRNPTSTNNTAVSSLVFNSNGKLLASGSYDGTAILWDLTGKAKRKTFAVRGEVKKPLSDTEYKPIYSLAFSPEKDLLAGGSDDEVFIWDIRTGKQVTEFSSGRKPAGILVSFNVHGNLVTGFSFDGAIILWDWRAKQTVGRQFYNPARTHSAAFSNNGNLLALPGEDGVVVWNVFSQRILTVGGTINSIAFSPSPDNKMLAAGTGDGSLTLWKTPSTEEHDPIRDSIQEASSILSLAFSGDGRLLGAGLQDGTISLRDPNDYTKQIKALDAQKGELVKRVSPDAGQPATAESEAADAEPEVPAPSPPPPVAVSKVVFNPSPESHLLAAVVVLKPGEKQTVGADDENYDPSKIILWNTDQTTSTELVTEPDNVVTSLAFSPDGQILASGNADKKKNYKIILWKGQKQEDTIPSADRVSSLAFSRKRQILAAGLDNGQILLWDLAKRRRLGDNVLEGLAGRVTDLAFSIDSMTLAVVTNKKLQHPQQGVITLWDIETREPIGNPLLGHDGKISAIAFSGDGKILASGSGDDVGSGDSSQNENNIILWDLDIEGADKRFCEIVNCSPAKKKSLFQLLYRKISSWFDDSA